MFNKYNKLTTRGSSKSPIDTLTTFETISRTCQPNTAAAAVAPLPARYAIRQALDQEFRKYILVQSAEKRQARYTNAGGSSGLPVDLSSSSIVVDEIPAQTVAIIATSSLKPSRDFFGRIITIQQQDGVIRKKDGGTETKMGIKGGGCCNNKTWVSFNEGFSNAVRKPITIEELMRWF